MNLLVFGTIIFEGHEPRLMTDKQIGEYTGLAKQQNRWWAIN